MLRQLHLNNYRNHTSDTFEFQHNFVLINGPNGSGKTNLIDSIHYLCLCKSYFQRRDAQLINNDSNYFRLESEWLIEGEKNNLVAFYGDERKKTFLINEVAYERLADHVGQFPVVMIAPDDTRLIQQYPEERRRFMDMAIGQQDRGYLHSLQSYNKWLTQRNALIKTWQKGGAIDEHLLNILGHELSQYAQEVYRTRNIFCERLKPAVQRIYKVLSGGKELPDITFQSDISSHDMLHYTMNYRREERQAGKTIYGPHRDDIQFHLDGAPFKQVASQGQIKSLLIALKLAQLELFDNKGLILPVLLLDDIFEKLDSDRMKALFGLLNEGEYSQVFLTDADKNRSQKFMKELGVEFDKVLTTRD